MKYFIILSLLIAVVPKVNLATDSAYEKCIKEDGLFCSAYIGPSKPNDNKWDHHLEQADLTWSIDNQIEDESGKSPVQ